MVHGNPGNRVYSFENFGKEVSVAIGLKHELTYQDLRVLLKYLARDRRSVVYDDQVCFLPLSHS